ncbi:hypothetical protein CDES_06615 [Corynebacterium deserti GIMN1.010]|uniref:Polysaccharide biosynthesis enzyme WcbI domain-containing protein n=1 Tax=Corynebacterium deserti GIMN1.010 TaxID=931089 RepID=A0A0M4CFW2_9CORY|nr:WcbI family polysaccharide biosynthesis putative acetyltransferase [Corynebacterium deserti]ALC05740.1 hypothetical protein CDES_06615 [Corynebacterium deserti GIMN1.010]
MNTQARGNELLEPATVARRRHYADFYRLRAPIQINENPSVAVVGNCQAESLRILLDSTGAVNSFRIPAIHEWTSEDIDLIRMVLRTTDILIMQPVRDNYRGLPCGTDQLARFLPNSGSVVRFPVLRFDGLMPYQAIIRSPYDSSLNPPVVPYHDLRTLVAASRGIEAPALPSIEEESLRELAQMSIAELRKREKANGSVRVSDFIETWPIWHTINHPDNSTLEFLAYQVLSAIGVSGEVQDPGRELLGGLDAPIDASAARALGVTVMGRETWRPLPSEDIHQAQLAFYREHPEVVEAGMKRHAQRLRLLGLI